MRSWSALCVAAVCLALFAVSPSPLQAQRIPFTKRFFNEQVLRSADQPVVPIYEGWYRNDDGTYEICFGYFNLNLDESVNIPLGGENFIEPSRYDGRQPTHFEAVPGMTPASPFTSRFRRFWCAFTVTVPATFGPDDRVTWTLAREDGEVVSTPGSLNSAYVLDEPASGGREEVAPTLRLSENGESFQGRKGAAAAPHRVRVGQPLDLRIWIEHPFEDMMWVGYVQYKGPGTVSFGPTEQRIRLEGGKGVASTRATFEAPGEYEVLVQAINSTAAFEFHCCWTNAYFKVSVVE